MKFRDGSRYTGSFKDGKAHGKGKWIHNEGHIFEGEFAHDEIDGQAVHTYPDGQRFEGIFRASIREGFGTLYNSDGTVEYAGEWSNDQRNGSGSQSKFTRGVKFTHEGNFENDLLEGLGTYTVETRLTNSMIEYKGEFKY